MNIRMQPAQSWDRSMASLRAVLKQFPFAWYKTLNRITLEIQAFQREHQSKEFTIRRKQYWWQAVKITQFAKKKTLQAKLQIVPKEDRQGKRHYDIWIRQEFGGTRRPVAGRKHLAIPVEGSEVERTGVGLIKEKDRPLRVRKRKRDFTVPTRGGGKLLFERIGPKSKSYVTAFSHRALGGGPKLTLKQDPNVRFLYYLGKKAEIDDVYEYYANARRTWDAKVDEIYLEEFRKAMADAADYWRRRGQP